MIFTRILIFCAAFSILGLGFYAEKKLPDNEAMPFLLGTLTLGGGFGICGLFSIKLPWHGVIGAGILALLGFGRGLINLPHFAEFLVGSRVRGIASVLEFIIMLLCAMIMVRVIRLLAREKARKIRE